MSVIILIFSLTWLFLRGVSGAAATRSRKDNFTAKYSYLIKK